eukprot:2031402-Rhodomonas_salina.1
MARLADKDGHGQILFDEFAEWCLKNNALVKEASATPAKKKKAPAPVSLLPQVRPPLRACFSDACRRLRR